MLTTQSLNYNTRIKQIASFAPTPSLSRNEIKKMNSSDLLSELLNKTIISNIDSYVRNFSKVEMELIKYLNYYFKKWNGNIQIPIKNIIENFANKGLPCSPRWIHTLLARIYDAGWVITTGGRYGRKVTKRTLTERGKIVMQAVIKGFGSLKQLIPTKSADYCADYSGGHTKYISSKVDIFQEGSVYSQGECSQERGKELMKAVREANKERQNE